jgi:hypothetical protein
MAANLTPQYLEAEAEYKKARTPDERLACLQKMWSLLPKHKASEKPQAELRKKISDVRDEVERHPKGAKKGGVSYKVPRQGAGQVILPGAPNMMDWEDVKVQLIDTPPITADFLEGYLSSMVRSADAALLLVDLGDDDGGRPFIVMKLVHGQTLTALLAARAAPAEDLPRWIARSIGRTVAEAVAEAVQAALADSPAGAGLPPRPPSYPGRPPPLEDQAAGPAWPDAADHPRPGLLPPRPAHCGTCTGCPPPGRRGGGRGRRALPEKGADLAREKRCVGWVSSARRVVRGGHRSPEECV